MIRNERGSALLTTLLTFAVVMIFGTILLSRGNYSMRETKLDVDHERARYVAESTLNATIGELKSNQTRLVNVVNTIQSGGTMVGTKPTSGTVSVAADSDYKVTIQQGSTSDYLEIIAEGKHNAATYSKTAVLKINRNGGLFSNGAALATTRSDVKGTAANRLTIVGNLIVRSDEASGDSQAVHYVDIKKNDVTNEGGHLYGYPNNKSIDLVGVTAVDMSFDANSSTTIGNIFIRENSKADNLEIRAYSPKVGIGNSSFKNMAIEINNNEIEILNAKFDNFDMLLKNDSATGNTIKLHNSQSLSADRNNVNLYGPAKLLQLNDNPQTYIKAGNSWAAWASMNSSSSLAKNIDTSNTTYDVERSLTLDCPKVDDIEKAMGCLEKITETTLQANGFTEVDLEALKTGTDEIAYREFIKEYPPENPGEKERVVHVIMSKSMQDYEITSNDEVRAYQYGVKARMIEGKDNYFVFNEGLEDNKVRLNMDYNIEIPNCYIYLHAPTKAIVFEGMPKKLIGSLVVAKFSYTSDITNRGPVEIVYKAAKDLVPTESITPGGTTSSSNIDIVVEEYK